MPLTKVTGDNIDNSNFSIGITTATSITATNLIGTNLNISGVSTHLSTTLIGSGTSTGTASQPLQVTGGAYVSGSVCINTINPSTVFHIRQPADFNGITVSHATRVGSWKLEYSGVNSQNFLFKRNNGTSDANSLIIGRDEHRWYTGNTERMTMISSGNLGIGTDNPQYPLHLYSASDGAELLQLEIGAQPANTGKGKIIWRATQSNGQTAKLASIGATSINNWGGELQFFTKTADSNANDTVVERVRIDNAGRLGIGTNSPFAKTHIEINAAAGVGAGSAGAL